MADEAIIIEVQDKVSTEPAVKIRDIATQAREAHSQVEKLKAALASITSGSAIDKLRADVESLSSQLTKATRSQTQMQASQDRATLTAQKLATEQAKTARETSNAAAASDRASLAALRLQQAQERQAKASEKAASGLASWAKAAIGGVAAGLSASAILKTADAYTTLQNKLQNVSESQAQVNELTDRLFTLANNARAPIEETATSFTRFDRALKIMGKSQEDSLRMTETINKALVVSGATATESASALLQLSQAFNSGKLQGEEFRAVAENMPLALDAIAKSTGKPIGQLKKMASEGKLTSEVLFNAFSSIAGQIDAAFAKTVPTIAQSFVVLRNNFVQMIGEFDKATGASAAIARAILFIGDNLKVIAVVAATAGALLLAAFGGPLIAAIASATAGLLAMAAAALANPYVALAVALVAVGTALALFGDKLKITADDVVSINDVFRALFSYVTDGWNAVTSMFANAWKMASDSVRDALSNVGIGFTSMGQEILSAVKTIVNAYIGTWVGAYNAIKVIWDRFPDVMNFLFVSVVNYGATAVENFVNLWQIGLRTLSGYLEKFAPDVAAKLNGALDATKLELPRMELKKDAADAASDVSAAFAKAFDTDYVGDAASAVMNRARKIAEARAKAMSGKSNLRGAGPDMTGDTSDGKAAEKRALALAKVNAELDTELARMKMLRPERDMQARFDQIQIALAAKKITLTNDEADSIKKRIRAIEEGKVVQQEFDRIYEESVEPLRTYNASITAATQLLNMGAITQERFNREILKAGEAYTEAADPLKKFNRDIEQQLEVLKKVGPAQEVLQQMQQIQNELLQKGIVLNADETKALQDKLTSLQETKMINQELNAIYANTRGAQEQLNAQTTALAQAYENGYLSLSRYKDELNQTAIAKANLDLVMGQGDYGDVALASLGEILNGYQGLMSGLSTSFGDFFASFTDGFANSIGAAVVQSENLGDALRNVAQQAVQGLISSLVKLGIQYALNAALGQSVSAATMAATTATSVGAAAITASAWAPAAALVSLASFGANAAPAAAGITAAAALAKATALTSMLGFEDGGYTGNVGTKQIAGVVHGQEYVFDAASTNRIGVANLEALRTGAESVAVTAGASGNSVGTPVSFTFENYGTPKNVEVQQISESEYRLIARDVASQEIQGQVPGLVANQLADPNSEISTANSTYTTAERRR